MGVVMLPPLFWRLANKANMGGLSTDLFTWEFT